jgi:uncharacterized protein (TIGR00303 family)
MIQIYTQLEQGKQWLQTYQGCLPLFACILGFTETALVPGISAAGATPEDRRYTAIADAEFLSEGPQLHPRYPLPPLDVGASPAFITRAVVENLSIPLYLFDAGLPKPPTVPYISLGGISANCLSTGRALPLNIVKNLYYKGIVWGEKLAAEARSRYIIIGECVVGGTTSALGVLVGLGYNATGKVNSSHPKCNHEQKRFLVEQGLSRAGFYPVGKVIDPFAVVAAVGDPMQIVTAGMTIAASRQVGVMLAGGTQMLAVCALIDAIAKSSYQTVNWSRIVVGTTRWVALDPTGDTVSLAQTIARIPLLATELNFTTSRFPQLRVYERGYVKEGVGAGGCAIASHLYDNWSNERLLNAVESIVERHQLLGSDSSSK